MIGRGGETIRSLQQGSGAHILVDQNYPEGQDRWAAAGLGLPVSVVATDGVSYHSSNGNCSWAKLGALLMVSSIVAAAAVVSYENQMILSLMKSCLCLQDGGHQGSSRLCRPCSCHGRRTDQGRARQCITDHQQGVQWLVGCSIRSGSPSSSCCASVACSHQTCAAAVCLSQLTGFLCGLFLQHGVGVTLTVQCPKGIVGRIIGKGGETIKGLQRKYHVSIQIDQGGDPMNVTITGQRQTAEYCKQEIQSLISDPGPPFGGEFLVHVLHNN